MEILKNARGIKIGSIYTASNGKKTIKDVHGATRGSFDPKTNKTKLSNGRTIGTGNQLSSLLVRY